MAIWVLKLVPALEPATASPYSAPTYPVGSGAAITPSAQRTPSSSKSILRRAPGPVRIIAKSTFPDRGRRMARCSARTVSGLSSASTRPGLIPATPCNVATILAQSSLMPGRKVGCCRMCRNAGGLSCASSRREVVAAGAAPSRVLRKGIRAMRSAASASCWAMPRRWLTTCSAAAVAPSRIQGLPITAANKSR